MTDNSNRDDILQGLPTWSSLSPKEQYDYVMADPEFQRRYLEGDTLARVTFNHVTQKFTEHLQAEKTKELADAIAASRAE